MTKQGTQQDGTTGPRRPALDHPRSMMLAATELDRFQAQLGRLNAADWRSPTACPAWDVRALSSHVLAMTEMFSSFRRNATQHLPASRAAKRGEVYIDALTARQVADRQELTPDQITQGLQTFAPRMLRWRTRAPGLMRARAMPGAQPVSSDSDAATERWTFGFLFDTVLTRDTWMHRMDIAYATGQDLDLSPDHDGGLVAEVVSEWSSRHTSPYSLTLTGPAGGTWSRGTGGEGLHLDAVEFCRALAGRAPTPGLLAVSVPF
jgi:uncharacterized protein (TIGR03083 family)